MNLLSELISKPVICMYDGRVAGTLENVIFNKRLDKIRTLIVYDEENQQQVYIPVSAVLRADKSAVMLKTLPQTTTDTQHAALNPVMSEVYSHDGELIGTIKDVQLGGGFVALCFVLSTGDVFTGEQVISYSDKAVIICQDKEQLSALKKPRSPKKTSTAKKPSPSKQEDNLFAEDKKAVDLQSAKKPAVKGQAQEQTEQQTPPQSNADSVTKPATQKASTTQTQSAKKANAKDTDKAAKETPLAKDNAAVKESQQPKEDIIKNTQPKEDKQNDKYNNKDTAEKTSNDGKASDDNGNILEKLLANTNIIEGIEQLLGDMDGEYNVGKMFVKAITPPELMDIAQVLESSFEDNISPDFDQEQNDSQSRQNICNINKTVLDKIFSKQDEQSKPKQSATPQPKEDSSTVPAPQSDDNTAPQKKTSIPKASKTTAKKPQQKANATKHQCAHKSDCGQVDTSGVQSQDVVLPSAQTTVCACEDNVLQDCAADYNDREKVYPRHILPRLNYLLGRQLYGDITDADGNTIAKTGDIIDAQLLDKCRRQGSVLALTRLSSPRLRI